MLGYQLVRASLEKTLIALLLLPSINVYSNSVEELKFQPVTLERLNSAAADNNNWLSHGRSYDESRFSPLTQINKNNVKDLALAWSFEFPDDRGLEATPIVVDGVIYTSGAWSRVFAHNARTGELLWSYDPEVAKEWLVRACCGPVNRGVAVWGNNIYIGTLDGYLLALDRQTGELVWKVLTIDQQKDYSITGAPRVVKGNVLIGNGGAEYGVRGYVSAYDAATGKLSWRFYTVPGNPAEGFESPILEKAAETWKGEWWALGGGGTVWDSMAYDPDLNLLYIGVGNGSPWNQEIRSPGGGDNLFLSSIVALNPDTGEYVWHYQSTPGESWDFTATQQMVLADIEWHGETRKVLMQAPKNGFFFIVDRVTGEFLSAEAFTKVMWAEGYDSKGRPIENPTARYREKQQLVMPGTIGGHNWHSMSYHRGKGLVYIPVLKAMMQYAQPANYSPKPHHQNYGADLPNEPIINQNFMQALKTKATRGELLAWDPIKQKKVWSYSHSSAWNGGVLATAGDLVFQGTAEQQFMAFDANNGDVLWSSDTKLAIVAAPVSYRVAGEQYVAVVAKWGGGYPLAVGIEPPPGLKNGRLLVFKLNGQASLPTPEVTVQVMNEPRVMPITDEKAVNEGKQLYTVFCAGCHGSDVISGGNVPDLRYRASQFDFLGFQQIVLEGALADRGMVSFSDVLDETKAQKVYSYILQQAHIEYENRNSTGVVVSIETWAYDVLATMIVLAIDGSKSFFAGVLLFFALLIWLLWRLVFSPVFRLIRG